MTYFSAITICVIISLSILGILVHENERLGKKDKCIFYVTYILIGLSAITEWVGVQISGNVEISSTVLRIVKCFDYLLTPMVGLAFVIQMRLWNTVSKILSGAIIFNTIFQIVSFFTGWMIIIDPDNKYSHGKLYIVYVITYLMIILLVVIQFVIYGMSYRKQNRTSLFLVLFLTIVGIAFQEIFGGDIRTSYIAITLGAAFMFIHITEFSQQKSDERIEQQKILITTDALTGLKSRYAYSLAIERYNKSMPKNMAVFSIDINGLKETNDILGHAAGDELIKGAATCIKKIFGEKTYRTGGDEFMVFAALDKKEAQEAVRELSNCAESWRGEGVRELHFAIGYALSIENEGIKCEDLIKLADEQMYISKEKYYLETGKNRRR